MSNQPRVMSYSDQIETSMQKDFEIGVAVAPDETDPFNYMGHTLYKTVDYMKSFDLIGRAMIGDEKIFETGSYSGGIDPIEILTSYLDRTKLPSGHVELTVVYRPVILLPQKPGRASWDRERQEYYEVPSNWFNVKTKEGKKFFEEWLAHITRSYMDLGMYERDFGWNARLSDKREKFYIGATVEKARVWDSELTAQENFELASNLLDQYGYPYNGDKLRKLLELEVVDG